MPSLLLRALAGAFLGFAALAEAHMQLWYPPAFNASNNPHRTTNFDEYLIYPYDCCGDGDRWMSPCRGYHKLLHTPDGSPTATWAAGSAQTFQLTGQEALGGTHYGGSCQVGFSTDGGANFHVATSYEGNCPHRHGDTSPGTQTFDFTVPSDLPAGIQVFAWIWYNREQEFNMNCAAVEITAAPASPPPSPPSLMNRHARRHTHARIHEKRTPTSPSSPTNTVCFAERPIMLIADNGNGCLTPHTTAEVKYPDPGPDVVAGDGEYPLALPQGNCDADTMFLTQGYHGEFGSDGHPLIEGA